VNLCPILNLRFARYLLSSDIHKQAQKQQDHKQQHPHT